MSAVAKAEPKRISQENAQEAIGVLKKWLSVSESQKAALDVLCQQLPLVNELMETSFSSLSSQFIGLSTDMQELRTLAKESSEDGGLAAEVQARAEKISGAMSTIIMDMQFQDRVSQNLVITMNVLGAISRYLQTELDMTQEALDHADVRARLDKAFATELVGLLNLGELKQRFIEHLIAEGFISDGAELGYSPADSVSKRADDEDDIELF